MADSPWPFTVCGVLGGSASACNRFGADAGDAGNDVGELATGTLVNSPVPKSVVGM